MVRVGLMKWFKCGEFFLAKKMVKKWYYENEGLGLARDRLIAFESI